VIPMVNAGAKVGKKRKVAGADEHDVVLDSKGNPPDFLEIEAANNGNAEPTQPASSSRVCGEADPMPETHLLSKLVPPEVMQRYQQDEKKLRRELTTVLLDDNI
jgi:hypothetical protein